MTAETNWKLLREYVAVSRFSRVRSSDHCSMSSAIATAPPAVATTPRNDRFARLPRPCLPRLTSDYDGERSTSYTDTIGVAPDGSPEPKGTYVTAKPSVPAGSTVRASADGRTAVERPANERTADGQSADGWPGMGGQQMQGRLSAQQRSALTNVTQAIEVCGVVRRPVRQEADPSMIECIRLCEDVAELGETVLALAPAQLAVHPADRPGVPAGAAAGVRPGVRPPPARPLPGVRAGPLAGEPGDTAAPAAAPADGAAVTGRERPQPLSPASLSTPTRPRA